MARKGLWQPRRDTAANWASVNPVLEEGEPGFETDTQRWKFGDGATAWNSLKYLIEVPVVGAKWDQSSSSPALTRIDLAGNTITPSTLWFDMNLPWAGMRRCNLNDSGRVTAYWGDSAFSYTGSMGQVMVEMPPCYYKNTKVGTIYTFNPYGYYYPGFTIHPSYVSDGVIKRLFIGAFKASVYDVTASAIEVNTITVAYTADSNEKVGIIIDGNYVVTVDVTSGDTADQIADKIVAAGAKTDYQGIVWTPAKTVAATLTLTAGTAGLKTTAKFGIYGTATGGSATTMVDSGKNFTVDALIGKTLWIITGSGSGRSVTITDNDATTITFATGTAIAAGSTYLIYDDSTGIGSVAKTTSGAGGYVANDSAGYDFTATTGDKFSSVAGVKPATGWNNSLSRTNARILASNRGTGWGLMTFAQASLIELLYIVEYANFNWQSQIGVGVTGITDHTAGASFNNSVNNGFTAGIGTGATDFGNRTGACTGVTHYKTSESANPNTFRGIEGIGEIIWEWIDGINIKADYGVWIADHDFVDDTYAHPYSDTGLSVVSSDGYPTDILRGTGFDYGFLASAVGGSSSTYLCDYFYRATGNRAARLGGGWNSGVNAGPFYWDLNAAASLVNRNVGGRLVFVG